MSFDWDPTKSEQNRLRRGFGFEFASLIFEGDTMEWPDDRHDHGEVRTRAIGAADRRILHVVFTDRGDVRRIISARLANKNERLKWHSHL